jgi:hypothetical protein
MVSVFFGIHIPDENYGIRKNRAQRKEEKDLGLDNANFGGWLW